jgi:hypothetical protein
MRYSLNVVEGEFCEVGLPLYGVLGTSPKPSPKLDFRHCFSRKLAPHVRALPCPYFPLSG